ncbi:MAG: sigma-70 family RNA polymerase sigma factor [Dorea sp.]|nr:sigma-70 family RNA polymerase sigma factor [Dorea sp.]
MEAETTGKRDFDKIYDANVGNVYRVAIKYAENEHEADEIVQSVFLKLYTNMDNINLAAVRKWLVMTTKYKALNLKRDKKREYLVDELTGEAEVRLSESVQSPEEIFLRNTKERQFRELKDDIFAALYKKSERWYDAVTITYILGKPQKEVAENMDVSLEVLQGILYRARQWIRETFAEEYAHANEE